MNTIERARKYGMEDGIQWGMEKVARKLFGTGVFSDMEVSKIAELPPVDRVRELRREVQK